MMLLAPLAGARASDARLPNHIATFVEARTADAVGDQARAARLFAALSRRDPANGELARRAVTTAIEAGDSDLAVSIARTTAPAALGLDGRLLLVADALRRGRANDALALINESTADSDGGFLAPLLRGWAEQQARIDGSVRLANISSDSLLAPFAAEQRAAMLLQQKRRDRKSTRLNSSHSDRSRMPSSA